MKRKNHYHAVYWTRNVYHTNGKKYVHIVGRNKRSGETVKDITFKVRS